MMPQVGLVNPVLSSPPTTATATPTGTPTSMTQQQAVVIKKEVDAKRSENQTKHGDELEQLGIGEGKSIAIFSGVK